ncbi:hypothetical protein KIPE111705_25765 [Kibdelosporangium persicum]|uniref:Ig-like domain-containing protein n=1 Tax=Kibdelosporangium persicum TaxID=2698649 RepID=A0ABX2FHA0_9PSEU|nr:hypothetical protein [Kibdelosporangium persicum]NRN70593.1 hypothetical protein [Kibdelosporangium persicum]
MPAKIDDLIGDLKVLRTGLGVEDPNLVARAGPAVRQVSGVTDGDSPGIVRQKITDWLAATISRLPEAIATIARTAFGFGGSGDLPYLARLEHLGKVVDREVRTMQRRADRVIYRIAEMTLTQSPPAGKAVEPVDGNPWHTELLRVDLILDQPEIEVFETRRIVSHADGLTEIRHWLTIAPVENPPVPLDLSDLGIAVLGGGDMATPPRLLSSNRVEIVLKPPKPLAIGDHHEFFFRVRVPSLLPFYACTPRFACDEFRLRIRFGRDRVPERVWLIDGELPLEASDPVPHRKTLHADSAGEVQATFRDLVPSTSYGIGWRPRCDAPDHVSPRSCPGS